MSETIEVKNSNGAFWGVALFCFLFFSRGCGPEDSGKVKASAYDHLLRAIGRREVVAREYEPLITGVPQ